MEGHLSAVAVGFARTDLSANIQLMARFFEQGVPADDDTCVRMMHALPENPLEPIALNISAEFSVEDQPECHSDLCFASLETACSIDFLQFVHSPAVMWFENHR